MQRTKDAAVRCWGQNTFGQLGDGTTPGRLIPVAVKGRYLQIAAGRMHPCAVMSDGGLAWWGRNEEGQLGDSAGQNRLEPTPVSW